MAAVVPLTKTQRGALAAVQAAWPDADLVLVGALALGSHIAMDYRATNDLDLAVGVAVDALPGPLAALAGWTQHATIEHRFFSPQKQQVDIVPASASLIQQGFVDWKHTRMSLIGFDLAL